ncbi:AraC family transcriptional regulator [Poseidonocella sp. HB161398]|uniref:helix-turn-helix domain-containing protein n=1 Tax=Poseidonocella sp. HB161398 TaxID=2320855 RepID=UPI0014862205|nr:AraC family transcriptional regulator [Poseidonocella sp. HB161398]
MTLGRNHADSPWSLAPIHRVEELGEAVRDAGLEALQMSGGPFRCSLAFAQDQGVTFSSGRIDSRVSLRGPLSQDRITFGVALRTGAGSRHWGQDIASYNLGLFRPGDEHDALYAPGSMYLAATLDHETLHRIAEERGAVIDRMTLGGTGILPDRLCENRIAALAATLDAVHRGGMCQPGTLHDALFAALLPHFSRPAQRIAGPRRQGRHALLARRARDFIEAHPDRPLTIGTISQAAGTSPRTLHRAFLEQLGETPMSHVLRLRLHGLRRDLLADAGTPVAVLQRRWGLTEPGRASGLYRELFGELPSHTRPGG